MYYAEENLNGRGHTKILAILGATIHVSSGDLFRFDTKAERDGWVQLDYKNRWPLKEREARKIFRTGAPSTAMWQPTDLEEEGQIFVSRIYR